MLGYVGFRVGFRVSCLGSRVYTGQRGNFAQLCMIWVQQCYMGIMKGKNGDNGKGKWGLHLGFRVFGMHTVIYPNSGESAGTRNRQLNVSLGIQGLHGHFFEIHYNTPADIGLGFSVEASM